MSILSSVVDIYQLFLKTGEALTVTTLVNELGMPKSSASRLLKQMADYGFLEREPDAPVYRPGMMILKLAHKVRSLHPLSDLMLTSLNELSKVTSFTSYVSVIDRDKVRVVHARMGTHMLQVVTQPGTLLPVTVTSTGRVLLSRAKPEVQQHFLSQNLEMHDWLEQELNTIKMQGWASSVNESVPGVASVSCAIYDPAQDDSFALCLSLPVMQVTEDLIQQLARLICQHASQIGCTVGDPYWLNRRDSALTDKPTPY